MKRAVSTILLAIVFITTLAGCGKSKLDQIREALIDNIYDAVTNSHDIVVPDFKGKYYSDVVNDPQYTNRFIFIEQNKVWNDEYEEGQIISQQPKDGTEVESEGFRIYLTVSKGVQKVEVPDVAQLSYQAAKAEIQKVNLTCVEEKKSDDDVPEGLVIGTSPKIGTPVKVGEEITVYVSTGP